MSFAPTKFLEQRPFTPAGCGALLLSAAAVLSACGDEERGKTRRGDSAQQETRCAHDVLESDLEVEPLRGSGVDPATGKLKLVPGERYIVSSTYGVPERDADGAPIERYLAIIGGVQEQLAREAGLLAISLSSSETCGSGRTLAIWKSEDQMYDFVTSPAHLTAMREADELLKPGYAVTHWEASSLEQMTLDEAVRQLANVPASR